MVSVVRCWKAEYQKCKHSILLYMHSMIPIICAAIFAGYYHISRWELATKISAYLEVLAVAFPFLIGIIVGLVVQIENQAGHYQLLLGTIPSRIATYIGKLGFLMICAMGATFLALGTLDVVFNYTHQKVRINFIAGATQNNMYAIEVSNVDTSRKGWKAPYQYPLENGKLLLQEGSKSFRIINSKDAKISFKIKDTFLGKETGYADEVDAYLYNTTEQKWISLDGTPYTA